MEERGERAERGQSFGGTCDLDLDAETRCGGGGGGWALIGLEVAMLGGDGGAEGWVRAGGRRSGWLEGGASRRAWLGLSPTAHQKAVNAQRTKGDVGSECLPLRPKDGEPKPNAAQQAGGRGAKSLGRTRARCANGA